MNKKSIIAIVAGISLIVGIIVGKRRRKKEEYLNSAGVLDDLDFIDDDFEDEEDYDYDV